jgi:hypothetical protein
MVDCIRGVPGGFHGDRGDPNAALPRNPWSSRASRLAAPGVLHLEQERLSVF